jgi:hypothetical protein
MTLLTVECVEDIRGANQARVVRRLIGLGLLIFAAVFTRYDGWALGAAVWCVVTWQLWRAQELRQRVAVAFAVFTLLAVSGPLLWLWYNQHFMHDPLDFMRGPHSAPAIEKRTAPPGSGHYRGWHDPGWALLLYTRAAQVVAAAWESGFAVMAAALAGLWMVVRQRTRLAALLLWLPLAFYVYSIAYGSVPIFIPQLWPHSHYNSRYGLELLPALALFACVSAAALEKRLKQPSVAGSGDAATGPGRFAWTPARWLYPVALALAVANPLAMIYGATLVQQGVRLVRHRPSTVLADSSLPVVLKEALVNATTRVPFERDVALVLEEIPPGAPILMQESDHIGALQIAGIPLRQTINETDLDSWHAALGDPAGHAAYVITFDGDAVAKAVAAHPQGLQELSILCGTGQGCARLYQSEINSRPNAPAVPGNSGLP